MFRETAYNYDIIQRTQDEGEIGTTTTEHSRTVVSLVTAITHS
jgi:hypothetical protein